MILRARWVLPIDRAPIAGGWVDVDAGRIRAIGDGAPPGPADDLGDVALMPGVVNAHTHLELSWMAGRVPPSPSMDTWIRTLMRERRAGPSGGDAEVESAMRDAAEEMRAAGTVLVGDVSNTLATPKVLEAAELGGVVFHELLGFNHPDPRQAVQDAEARLSAVARDLRVPTPEPLLLRLAAHAPYSVSAEMIRAIAERAEDPLTIHLGESAEELEFLRAGTGPIRRMLEELDVWTPAWRVPACDPVEYIASLGYLRPGVLVVHGVKLGDRELERLRDARAIVVTCPRSNEWVGAGPPRLAHFYALRVPVAIGTDSLASAPSLSIFDELAELRRLAPEVAAGALLDSATRQGAQALGFGRDFGTLGVGKRAALIGVEVPAAVRDVEEYLVSGVPARAIRRVA